MEFIHHFLADPVTYIAYLVFAGSILNAALPSEIGPKDKVPTPTTKLGFYIQTIRRSRVYSVIRQCISLCAIAIVWARSFVDPKQRDQLQKVLLPFISLITAVDTAAGVDDKVDTPVAAAATLPEPSIQYTLSGPVVTGITPEHLSTITVDAIKAVVTPTQK